ncbi:hypothetical protein B0H13DRAFT_1862233 [Mycena leptocephala]|nr:hypothetical protein B0H13DRAFT_1862233 [Mycena leptocephala]
MTLRGGDKPWANCKLRREKKTRSKRKIPNRRENILIRDEEEACQTPKWRNGSHEHIKRGSRRTECKRHSLAVRQRDNGISGGMQVYFLMCEVVKTGASLKANILRLHERNDIMGRAMSVIQGNYPYARAGQIMTRNFCCRGEEPYARVPEANDNQGDFAEIQIRHAEVMLVARAIVSLDGDEIQQQLYQWYSIGSGKGREQAEGEGFG